MTHRAAATANRVGQMESISQARRAGSRQSRVGAGMKVQPGPNEILVVVFRRAAMAGR